MGGHSKYKVAAKGGEWSEVEAMAREYVYALLERELADTTRRANELELQACIEVGSRPIAKGQGFGPERAADASSGYAAEAQMLLAMALEVLREQDEHYCFDCEEIHEPDDEKLPSFDSNESS